MINIHDVEQGSKEWFELRQNRITGTSAKDLLLSDSIDAALLKINTDFKGNYHTERGKTLEPQAIQLYNEIYSVDIAHFGFITNTKWYQYGYSPDGVLPDRLIEVKCFGKKRHMESIETLPFEVQAQIHFGMMICELPQTDVILYNPDLETDVAFKVINVQADEKIQNNFRSKI